MLFVGVGPGERERSPQRSAGVLEELKRRLRKARQLVKYVRSAAAHRRR